jgi:hypothetical protein
VCPGEGSAGSRQQAGRALVRAPGRSGLGCWRQGADPRGYIAVLRFQGFKVFFRVSDGKITSRVYSEPRGKSIGLGDTFYHLGNTR